MDLQEILQQVQNGNLDPKQAKQLIENMNSEPSIQIESVDSLVPLPVKEEKSKSFKRPDNQGQIPVSHFTNLFIEIPFGFIEVVQSQDEFLHYTCSSNEEEALDKWYLNQIMEDDSLKLVLEYPNKTPQFMKKKGRGLELYLEIPAGINLFLKSSAAEVNANSMSNPFWMESIAGQVELVELDDLRGIQVTSADIEIMHCQSKNWVQLQTKSGDCEIVSCSFDFEFSSSSGDLEVMESAGEMKIHSLSGSIEVQDSTGSLAGSTKSGDIEISQLTGVHQVRTMSGDIEVELNGVKEGDHSFQSTSGDINISLANSQGKLFFKSRSGSWDFEGNNIINSNQDGFKEIQLEGEGAATFNIQTVSGDIAIEQDEG